MATIEDIHALPEGIRAELIDGVIYYPKIPLTMHQGMVVELGTDIQNYIKDKRRECKVYSVPFPVYLQGDRHYVEPDIFVICDKDKLDERGCNGAPDWIIEVISPGNASYDTIVKLELYINSGVREYWVVDLEYKKVFVYCKNMCSVYGFTKVKSCIFEDLEIDFSLICDDL